MTSQAGIVLALTAFSMLFSPSRANDIHKLMSIEELQSTFHVDHHDLVPEYEVVHIHHQRLKKRDVSDNLVESDAEAVGDDVTSLKLKAFGKYLNLSLVPNRQLFRNNKVKIWTVEPNATAQHGVEYIELPESENEDVGEIFQDEENEAAILLRKDNGSLTVEGSIGPDLVIRPIPHRLLPGQGVADAAAEAAPDSDDEMFLDADGELSSEVAIDTGLPIRRSRQGHKHIVYKKRNSGSSDDFTSDYAFMEPDRLAKRFKRSSAEAAKSRPKRQAPYIIYPEILVIVDYDGYRLHGGDNLQIKRYFVSFWNGVDLRYKLLKGPRVRVSIAGIIISRGRDATPYLERNRVGRDAIDSAAALTDMGKYLFRERRLPVYDIAVAITKLDMCRRAYPNDVCNRGTAGFAYVGGACVVNKRLEKVNSVAIIEDTGGFSGIIVAAHEVGHLLGAVHDGSPPPSYLGGPGAEKCQWTDGYIMSDLRHTERGFRWSVCSIQSFHHFLNGDTATCLFNVPHEDDSLPRVLPGKLLTLDAQCRRDRGTSACFKDDRVCAQLFCFDAGSGYCVAYRPAAEGSPCGDGQYCLNGRCVPEHENIIPDYTQNTPAYIRGNSGRPLFYEDEAFRTPETPRYYFNNNYNNFNQYSTQPPQYNNYNNYNQFTTKSLLDSYNEYKNNQFNYNQYTTQPPYNNFNYYTTPFTTARPPFSLFSFSTTRSPYNFNNFGNYYSTTPRPLIPYTTKNYFPSFSWHTTKSPYDFAHFGRSTPTYNQNINNNYLKRSYNAANYYYGASSNVKSSNTTITNTKNMKS